jgi:hypothetical protein
MVVLEHLGQCHAECPAALVTLIAHHDGNQLELAQHFLQPGQLDLNRVLWCVLRCLVALIAELNRRAHLHQPLSKFLVDGDCAERRRVGIAVIDRGEVERYVVRGRDDHDARVLVAFERGEGPGSDGSRVGIAGVRRDRGENLPIDGRRRGFGQHIVDHL